MSDRRIQFESVRKEKENLCTIYYENKVILFYLNIYTLVL